MEMPEAEEVDIESHNTENAKSGDALMKKTSDGVILIPQPTSNPADPLNWPDRKKYRILAALCLASFAGLVCNNAGNAIYPVQAPIYHKTPIELSYSVSSGTAGAAVGALIFGPFVEVFGSSSIILWSLVCTLAFQIWSASATSTDDYIPFVVSRLFVGLFGGIPSIVGARKILDLFFLHQRGRAFAAYNMSFILGAIAAPTFGGFIVETQSWTVAFWWTLAPLGLAIIMVFLYVEETSFARGTDSQVHPRLPASFVKSRVATFLPGTNVVPGVNLSRFARTAVVPFIIGIYPVTILADIYSLVSFGFALAINALLAAFLQAPVKAGGYGFSPLRIAAFTFTTWFAIIAAELTSHYLNDRIPLILSRRSGRGIWHPEYRLYNLIIPALLQPVGLGIFGAGLQYHLHYMVLALGAFLDAYGGFMTIPICVNYVIECFTSNAVEVSIVMNLYRLLFGVAIPFFVSPWIAKVGIGWVFGMAALFSLFISALIGLLIWKGETLRRMSPVGASLATTDEGKRVNVLDNRDFE